MKRSSLTTAAQRAVRYGYNLGRVAVLLLAAVMLSGCATAGRDGPPYSALAQSKGPPKAGQARIIVFREGSPGLFNVAWDVTLDGAAMGGVRTSTFIYRDVPAGRHKLVLLFDPFPRPSTLEFDVASGRTYAFRVEMGDKGRLMMATGAAAGIAGLLIVGAISAAADERGSYDFVPVDPGAVAGLSLAEPSKPGG
jgi:hypothetical protein